MERRRRRRKTITRRIIPADSALCMVAVFFGRLHSRKEYTAYQPSIRNPKPIHTYIPDHFPGGRALTHTSLDGYITMRNTPIHIFTHSLRLPLQSSFFMINIQRRALAPHPGSFFLEAFGQTSSWHSEYPAIRRFSHMTPLALCTRNCLPASCQPKPQPPPH